MKIKVSMELANDVDKLAREGLLILPTGRRTTKLGQELSQFNGGLLIGRDNRRGKTVFVMTRGVKKKRRKDHPAYNFSVFTF